MPKVELAGLGKATLGEGDADEDDRGTGEEVVQDVGDAGAEHPRTTTDGWLTWIDPAKIHSPNPGCCFKQAGWTFTRNGPPRREIRD